MTRLQPRKGAAGLFFACLCIAVEVCGSRVALAADQGTLHGHALAAVADIRTAIGEIERSANVTADGAAPYKRFAQRTINVLVGAKDPEYRAASGNPGDALGALGHTDWLLHRPGNRPWNAAVHGAWVNVTVAVANLHQALAENDLDDFETDVTQALESLEMALGRPSEGGTLGGLEGALATTELGIPAGATRVSGCTPPARAPAYGVTKGYLLYVAVPRKTDTIELPQRFAERSLHIHPDFVVIDTPAANKTAELCPQAHAAAADASAQSTFSAAADPKSLPHLYTKQQAQIGLGLYLSHCARCHGKDLQGTSAPANAGTAFLQRAKTLGWSVSDLRYLVVNTMPFSNPGSFTPEQYADVIAYLLSASCYPPGKTPFPTHDTPRLKHTKLGPLPGVQPDNPKLGTCHLG